jgi:hypothetical protein
MRSPENIARILHAVQTTFEGRIEYWTLTGAIQSWTDSVNTTERTLPGAFGGCKSAR